VPTVPCAQKGSRRYVNAASELPIVSQGIVYVFHFPQLQPT
jgi:hypothetical protein